MMFRKMILKGGEKKREMKGLGKLFLFTLAILVLASSLVLAVVPSGADTVTSVKNETAPADNPTGHEAIAGNVTELTITGYTTTQAWQGYFGNVTGTIQLADANDNVMYNWSVASPSGEVYASESNSVTWASIACYNWVSDGGVALETSYNIAQTDVDGINETFATGSGHDEFFSAGTQFATGTCMSTTVYGDTGAGVNDEFEEVLLYDGSDAVFASLLEDDMLGFDDAAHDFEMLVLEDGHGTDVATTTYYFYVELE